MGGKNGEGEKDIGIRIAMDFYIRVIVKPGL